MTHFLMAWLKFMSFYNDSVYIEFMNQIKTRADVCKTLCPQHMLAPKDGQVCTVPKFPILFLFTQKLIRYSTHHHLLADQVSSP